MQYIRIHLTNYLRDFNAENYKITDEKVNEDQNKWRRKKIINGEIYCVYG